MEKKKSLLQWFVVLVMLGFVLYLSIDARAIRDQSDEIIKFKPDVIVIDMLKSFGPLERPGVIFFHDGHTDALKKENKDCGTCHFIEKPDKDFISLKFKRLKDNSKQDVMEIYHSECIGCHKAFYEADKKAGPIETCGECHKKDPGVISSRQPMGFDKSLHFRHTKAATAPCQKYQWQKDKEKNKGDCALCHHEYDESAKKLVYVKGQEGSCRYCHKKETEGNRISMRYASHLACIDCHKKTVAENKKAGPVTCRGCHDLKEQEKIKKLDAVPRIERNQPDVVLLQIAEVESNQELAAARMKPVPFDHKSHEAYNASCIICHHSSLDSCSKKCHTLAGSKEGDYVNLERAMHQKNYEESCVGCHKANQKEPRCAACHAFLEAEGKASSACQICHMNAVIDASESALDRKVIAEKLLKARKAVTNIYKDEDIPEKVIIQELSDKYEPVELPHRKIVHTLQDNIKDSKLAGYFHAEKGSICQGCHHNSPLDKKPPRCASCHGKPFDGRNIFRPGIKGAYHQQCMGCHGVLNLDRPKSTRCIDCHKEKKQGKMS